MKLFKLLSFLLFASFAFVSCDELFEEEDSEPQLLDYADVRVTNCERIGSVLILELSFKNKTKETLRNIYLGESKMTDNLGGTYSGYFNDISISVNKGEFTHDKTFSVLAGETVIVRYRVAEFDQTNKSTKVDFVFSCSLPSVDFSGDTSATGVAITDNRVVSNGVQTPDNGLEIKVLETKHTIADKKAYIKFTVKNVAGEDINNFSLSMWKFSDDTGQEASGYRNGIHVGTNFGGEYEQSVTRSLAAGETVTYVCKIDVVSNTATRLSGRIFCSTGSYVLADNEIRFFDIPLAAAV